MQELIEIFRHEAGEVAFGEEVAAAIRAERFAAAEDGLMGDLAAIHPGLHAACLASKGAALTGWEEAIAAVRAFEGERLTALAITLFNEQESALTAQEPHEPSVEFSVLTDESFPFSETDADGILAENTSYYTEWQGKGEDIEAYLEMEGLAELNAVLLNHKTRVFLRSRPDEEPRDPPLDYVAYIIACWVRVLRFHQAVRTALEALPTPLRVPVILGMRNIKPFLGAVLYADNAEEAAHVETAELKIRRPEKVETVSGELSGTAIRRQLREASANDGDAGDQPKKGILARLFGR